MGELYPTRTRLQLLRDVRDGKVGTDITADVERIVLWPYAPTEWQTQQTVTARVLELEQAGWVRRSASGAAWLLTDAGEKVLADG
jgi:hypothetical protein